MSCGECTTSCTVTAILTNMFVSLTLENTEYIKVKVSSTDTESINPQGGNSIQSSLQIENKTAKDNYVTHLKDISKC